MQIGPEIRHAFLNTGRRQAVLLHQYAGVAVLREFVFKADDQNPLGHAQVLQGLQYRSTGTAFAGAVFQGDQSVV